LGLIFFGFTVDASHADQVVQVAAGKRLNEHPYTVIYPDDESLLSHQDIIDGVTPPPMQYDGGNCIFIAATGAVEFILRKNENRSIQLSSRHLTQIIGSEANQRRGGKSELVLDALHLVSGKPNAWLLEEDLPIEVSKVPTLVLNRSERETREFYTWITQVSDPRQRSEDPRYLARAVSIPKLEKVWEIGYSFTKAFLKKFIFSSRLSPPENFSQKLRDALDRYRKPIIVTYWTGEVPFYFHTVLVVGYDRQKRLKTPCYSLREITKLNSFEKSYEESLNQCDDPQGVFYVRDSYYNTETSESLYPWVGEGGDKSEFQCGKGRRVILRESELFDRMGMHAVIWDKVSQ